MTKTRRPKIPAEVRRQVEEAAEDHGRYVCYLCGRRFPRGEVQVEHKAEWADGGTHDAANLGLACRPCHEKKTLRERRRRERAERRRALLGQLPLAAFGAALVVYAWLRLVGREADATTFAHRAMWAAAGLIAAAIAWPILGWWLRQGRKHQLAAVAVDAPAPVVEPDDDPAEPEDRVPATLREIVPLPPPPAEVDLSAVVIGRRADGTDLSIPILGNTILVAGIMGSGKASVVWTIIHQLAPAIRAGLVKLVGIDPKGGMELYWGRALFAEYADEDEEAEVRLLEKQVRDMQARARRLRGRTRKLQPTVDDPLVLIVVDEIADLTAYNTDTKQRARAQRALGRLDTKGRAVGYALIGEVQDVRVDKLDIRDLFSTKIGLRLPGRQKTDMVLGDGARELGARCDCIPRDLPGVGYVRDGDGTPVQFRAPWVSDEVLAAMAAEYAPPNPGLEAEREREEGNVRAVAALTGPRTRTRRRTYTDEAEED